MMNQQPWLNNQPTIGLSRKVIHIFNEFDPPMVVDWPKEKWTSICTVAVCAATHANQAGLSSSEHIVTKE